ncbi:MAG TPA: hypothetical protein VFE44_06925 [Thermoanaerobaculia bacterium]|nr:hypothetical protein [Thermoanaerobaculia bacterium]
MARRIAFLVALLFAGHAAAQAQAETELEAVRREIAALRSDYDNRLGDLERRLAELEAGAVAAPAPAVPAGDLAPPASSPPVVPSVGPAGPAGAAVAGANYFNPAISLVGNFVAAGGDETADGAAAAELQESELGLQAVIDPYARADFFLAFGEEGVEVEEGYATFTALPADLLLKVGRMKATFGKVNTLHSHTLPWADQPLPVTTLLGDEGWIGTGVSLARLVPLPADTFSEITLQVFRGDAEGLFEAAERNDLAYNAHYRLFRDLSEATNLDVGLSYGLGPNGVAPETETALAGVDATLRWKPLRTALYRSAIFRGEVIRSRREQEESTESALGWFASGDYQFARRWAVGGRLESVERPEDSSLDDRGEAFTLTFSPSEFARLRGELRRRRFAEGDEATEVFLQLLFAIGAHGAHPF